MDEPVTKSQKDGGIRLRIGDGLDSRKNVWAEPRPFDELPEDVRNYLSDRTTSDRKKERTTIEKLEGKHVLSTILYINSVSPVMKSDIYNNVSRSSSMIEKIGDLYDMGLVEIYNTGHTNASVIVMTDKGKRVAKVLTEILDVIENDGLEE